MSNDIMILMRFWILDRCLMEFDYVFEHFFKKLFLVYLLKTIISVKSWEFDPACAESCLSKSLHWWSLTHHFGWALLESDDFDGQKPSAHPKGATLEETDAPNGKNWTPNDHTTKIHKQAVQSVFMGPCNLDLAKQEELTALHYAAFAGSEEAVEASVGKLIGDRHQQKLGPSGPIFVGYGSNIGSFPGGTRKKISSCGSRIICNSHFRVWFDW